MFSLELLAAVEAGDALRVARTLDRRLASGDPCFPFDGCRNVRGKAVLFIAIERGDVEIVEMLLDHTASLEQVDDTYSTPLLVAAEHGHRKIVAMLLSRGADVNATNWKKETALVLAAVGGHVQVVDALIEAGADLDYVGPYVYCLPALGLAASHGRTEIVATLLAAGATIEVETNSGFTALILAAIAGHSTVVSQLLGHQSPHRWSARSRVIAMVHAICRGFEDIVDMLLAAGDDTHEENDSRVARVASCIQRMRALPHSSTFCVDHCMDGNATSALFLAVKNGFVDIVEMLVDAGGNIEENSHGFTPMLIAAKYGHIQVIQLLISRSADVGTARYQRDTPLMVASSAGHTAIVIKLLQAGAPVNHLVNIFNAGAPLLRAAKNGHRDIVLKLLEAGADIEIAGRNGKTALCFAAMGGHEWVVKTLLNHGAIPSTAALVEASCRGLDTIVTMLLEAQARVNDGSGRQAALASAAASGQAAIVDIVLATGPVDVHPDTLIAAVKAGHEGIVDKLLAAGAKLQTSRNRRRQELYQAARHGHAAIVKKLLAAGADVDNRDGNGNPTLAIACRNGNMDIVEALIDAGALADAANESSSVQAVHNAAKYNRVDVLDLLVSRGADIAKNARGVFPSSLCTASTAGSTAVVRFLLAHGCELEDINAALRDAASAGHVDVVRELVSHGADLTAYSLGGEQALHSAAMTRHGKKVVEYLCSDPSVGVVDPNGSFRGTPFAFALGHRSRESLAALIQRGVDIDVHTRILGADWKRTLVSLNLPLQYPSSW